jgi:outer membrane protein assembly factor BamB
MRKYSKIFRWLVVCLIIWLGTGSAVPQTNQWPMINRDTGRTSWAADEDVLQPPFKDPEILYIDGLSNVWYEMMTCLDGLLAVGLQTEGENMFAMFDVATGDTLWTFSIPSSSGSPSFVPAQNDSLVFCGGQNGPGLYALYRYTGEVKWCNATLGSLYGRGVIPGEGRIYISKSFIYCLYMADGTSNWSRSYGGTVTPALDDNACYVCGALKAARIGKLTAELFWEIPSSEYDYTTLAVYGDVLYMHSNDTLFARDKYTAADIWSYTIPGCTLGGNVQNNVAVSDSVACFTLYTNPEGKGRLLTLDRTNGTYLWHHDFDDAGVFPPAIANGVVYVVDLVSRDLFGFDLSDGTLIFQNSDYNYTNQPIIADHKLFVGSGQGVIIFENEGSEVTEQDARSPGSFTLHQNYPNPFNPSTEIRYSLSVPAHVSLILYNIHGEKVLTLKEGREGAGEHRAVWNGTDQAGIQVPSGMYICRMKSGSVEKTIQMMLMK